MCSVCLEDLFCSVGSYGLGQAWGQSELVVVMATQKGLLLSGSRRFIVLQCGELMLPLTQRGCTNLNTTDEAAMAELMSQKLIMSAHTGAELCHTRVAGLKQMWKESQLEIMAQ